MTGGFLVEARLKQHFEFLATTWILKGEHKQFFIFHIQFWQ